MGKPDFGNRPMINVYGRSLTPPTSDHGKVAASVGMSPVPNTTGRGTYSSHPEMHSTGLESSTDSGIPAKIKKDN